MSSTVSQIVTSADLKQSSESGSSMGRLGAVNREHNSLLVRRLFRYNGATLDPNGPDYESATSSHDHRVYGHMPNSLM
jgi:hypothetical protein